MIPALERHLALRNPRFLCRGACDTGRELVVPVTHEVGRPAGDAGLRKLRELAGPAHDLLAEIYRGCDGLRLHTHGGNAGLRVFPIEHLQHENAEWREWLSGLAEEELYPFQLGGFAFATIEGSGNYFVAHDGRVYYSDHDGGDDDCWGDLDAFVARVVSDPVRFLSEAGGYTRYSDGRSNEQFIPYSFVHGSEAVQ